MSGRQTKYVVSAVLLSLALLGAVTRPSLGEPCGSLDQTCEWNPNGATCWNVDQYYFMMQSFTAEAAFLCGVELLLGPSHEESEVFLRIQDSPIPDEGVITSTHKSIEWHPMAWEYFDVPDVALEPGTMYYIFITDEYGILWCSGLPYCDYEGGTGYRNGNPINFDWGFRTYGDKPTVTSRSSWGRLKAMYR
jgi:hypothetical protein